MENVIIGVRRSDARASEKKNVCPTHSPRALTSSFPYDIFDEHAQSSEKED